MTTHELTAEQYRLLNRPASPWLTLWLIADFESGRSYAVGASGGGTHHFGDGQRGQYEVTGKGMTGWRRDRVTPEVTVTWGEVKRWAAHLAPSTRDTAATLRRAGQELQAAYPSPYPGIGRAYSWDRPDGGTPDERDKDRADLAAAHARRALEVEAWQVTKDQHTAQVSAFLESLAPDDEPVDLLELLAVSE